MGRSGAESDADTFDEHKQTQLLGPAAEGQAAEPVLSLAQSRPIAFGRYALLAQIGRGGGGTVFRAYDPELHREVAIKLLHGGKDEAARRRSTLREAQAAAQLNHPNIVTIYDVGQFDDPDLGQGVFMVMELVPGVSLNEWAKAHRNEWRKIIKTLIPAGRGLAAAHAAGLVHRDFKLGNVIVPDSGRVRVVDFGLARTPTETTGPRELAAADGTQGEGESETTVLRGDVDAGAADETQDLARALKRMRLPATERPNAVPFLPGARLTNHGEIKGTPPFMAPELHADQPADAASDQYAFCVALYRCISGTYPYRGTNFHELGLAKQHPARMPARSKAPGWVWRIVIRGLSPDPKDRFENMNALLAALERGLGRRRLGIGVASLSAIGLLSFIVLKPPTPVVPEGCEAALARADALWSQAQRDKVDQSFARSGLPFARSIFEQVDPELSTWSSEWKKRVDQVCVAVPVDAPEAQQTRASQLACLGAQAGAVETLIDLAESQAPTLVRRMEVALQALPEPQRCLSDATEVASLRAELALLPVELRREVGDIEGARAEAQRLAQQEDQAIQGGAQVAMCGFAYIENDFDRADDRCFVALRIAESIGDDLLAVRSMVRLSLNAWGRGEFTTAQRLLELSETRLAALPQHNPKDTLGADIQYRLGLVQHQRGQREQGLARIEAAVRQLESQLGEEHPALIAPLNALGIATKEMERYEEAQAAYERALALSLRFNGPKHDYSAGLLNNLGALAIFQGRWVEALDYATRAHEMKAELYGPWAGATMMSRANVAWIYLLTDRPRSAADYWAPGWEHFAQTGERPKAWYRALQAFVLYAQGDCEAAWSTLQAATPDELEREGPSATVGRTTALTLECLGRRDDAIRTLEALLAQASELSEPDLIRPVIALARMRREAGDVDGARTLASEWVERMGDWSGDPDLLAAMQREAAGSARSASPR